MLMYNQSSKQLTIMSNTQAKYEPTRVAVEKLGVAVDTLRRWHREGNIEVIRTAGGRRLYNVEAYIAKRRANAIAMETPRKTIGYCRVANESLSEDLAKQVADIKAAYPEAIIIEEIASGCDWKRRGIQSVIRQVSNGDIGQVVVANTDRIGRLAVELVQCMFDQFDTKIVALSDEASPLSSIELAEDMLTMAQKLSGKSLGRKARGPRKVVVEDDASDAESDEE